MIDSDMVEYTTDENGTPLSLQEMRSFIQQDKAFTVNVLPGLEKHWVAAPSGKAYMQAYWAKNLYWFDLFTVYAFDLEYGYNSEGVRTYYSEYTCLVPPDFDSPKLSSIPQKTSNAEAFWSK